MGQEQQQAGVAPSESRSICDELKEDDFEELAKALFEEQERMIPEGETWDEIFDKAYYSNSVKAVFRRLKELRLG